MSRFEDLSTNAQKVLRRMHRGAFYVAFAEDTPKAMQELQDRGFVTFGARYPVMQSCYVPVGTRIIHEEYIPPVPGAENKAAMNTLNAATVQRQIDLLTARLNDAREILREMHAIDDAHYTAHRVIRDFRRPTKRK